MYLRIAYMLQWVQHACRLLLGTFAMPLPHGRSACQPAPTRSAQRSVRCCGGAACGGDCALQSRSVVARSGHAFASQRPERED